MKKEILINGVNINLIEKDLDKIRKSASSIISNNIDKSIQLIKLSVSSDNKDEVIKNLLKAKELIEEAKEIGDAVKIEVNVPYYEDDEERMIRMLEDSELVSEILNENKEIEKLYYIIENLEYQNRKWHASTC